MLTYPLSPWAGIAISVPLAFLVAQLFASYGEAPSHRLAKWAGTRTAHGLHPTREPAESGR